MTPRDRLVDLNFEAVAEHYSGRLAYLPGFFAKAAEIFELSKSSTVVDLGCGTGAVSLGFAPYCKSVVAVDRSPNMMAHWPERPGNLRFVLADLNAETVDLRARADLVAIGMAVHFFDKKKLIPLLDAVATPSVLICGTTISERTPWFGAFSRSRKRYGTVETPLDLFGEACFSGTGWSPGRSLRVTARQRFSVRDLLSHALSYPTSLDGILRNKDGFERDLETSLTPYFETPNHVVGAVITWGFEYQRPQART